MGYESDFAELVWENGQLLVRGGSDPDRCRGESFDRKKSSPLQGVLFQDFEHNRLEGVPEEAPASDASIPPLTSMKHFQVSVPTRKTNQSLIPFGGSPNQHENRKKTNFNPNHPSIGTSRPMGGLSAAEGFNGNDNKHATGRGSGEFGPASALEERRIKFPGCVLDSGNSNLEPSRRNKPPKALLPDELSESNDYRASCKIKCSTDVLLDPSSSLAQNTSKRMTAVRRNDVDQLVASSCGASNDLTYTCKRKREDNDSYTNEEDFQHNCLNKVPDQLSKCRKGSRVPEVHNLSEKRRRAKFNKKMRALQELIPNCSKVDKASLLDEAIGYLKALQLQVQMMAMGTAMFNPGLMLPTAMQHMNTPHLGNYSALANIMPGMRMQMLGGCSPLQVPHSLIPGSSSPPGVPEAQPDVACFPSQALPMPVTHSPFLFLPQMASSQYVQAAQNALASDQMQLQKSAPLPAGKKSKQKD